MVSLVLAEHMGGASFVPRHGDYGYRRTLSRDRRPYETADGFIGVIIYTDRQWKKFFDAIGQAEKFAADTRFQTAAGALGLMSMRSTASFSRSCADAARRNGWRCSKSPNIPAAPGQFNRRHPAGRAPARYRFPAIAGASYRGQDDDACFTVRALGLAGAGARLRAGAGPALGEILRELGYADSEIDALAGAKAIVKG